MDEILIEEKKFVSSKRAAKMTGYAKDYIGQLCREGRVPARLIGRSWYVLEAAIQDHRFGNPEIESAEKEEKTAEIISTWESPRYESSSEELLPSINRFKETEYPTNTTEEVSQHIQDSWKAWFDRFDHIENTDVAEVIPDKLEEQEENEEESAKELEIEEETKVNVPIHTVSRPLYRPPPVEFLPHRVVHLEQRTNMPSFTRRKNNSGGIIRTIQVAGAVLSIIVAVTAVIGSGYFDEYIISNSQARIIAGVILYNK